MTQLGGHPLLPLNPPIPDELTDEERRQFSDEAAANTTVHLGALIQAIAKTGPAGVFALQPAAASAELIAFAGQIYIDAFRGRVLRHVMRKMDAYGEDSSDRQKQPS